ncbi:alpha/beta-hydrolase [Basidiobolus meristosporus CBS 931.73]|uniref:Alpha/beta-hydrolase n=1 Tax=Basidiobolus meristosporus CBS 931.73 TaxID=1314790 RepID=A0A1Y1YK84_9FUNG|nr:alpha/beta-hydrolase [Basidiobolus meristosporus CBS 931.73]|eukprot:ORX98398.1 alpha/beta-hydrolase [Basidiobolus meristosporus CBS 931.73]
MRGKFCDVLLVVLLYLGATIGSGENWKDLDRPHLDKGVFDVLRLHAEYAGVATCLSSEVADWSCYHCVGDGELIGEYKDLMTGGSSYVAMDRKLKKIILGFRGTINLQGILYDLDLIPIPYIQNGIKASMKVHGGFWKSFEGLKPGYRKHLLKALNIAIDHGEPEKYEIVVVGLSLGAALATLGGFDIKLMMNNYTQVPQLSDALRHFRKDKFYLHTFGSPRVGNRAMAQFMFEVISDGELTPRVLRVVNANDPVPHGGMRLFGFHHIPHEVWIGHDGVTTFECNDVIHGTVREDPLCSFSIDSYNPLKHIEYWDFSFTLC